MKQVYSPYYALVLASADAFELSHPSTIYTNDNVEVITATNAIEAETKLVNATTSSLPTLPDVGKWIEKDKLYLHEGKIYRCIQSHYRTIYTPDETLALFNVYRKETTGMQWITGEKVLVDCIRIYNGVNYKCLQSHVTQSDWTPDKTIGTLWGVVVTTNEWAVGVAYKVGDIVTYQGKTYKCLQAHTSISTWYPSVVPALWQLQ